MYENIMMCNVHPTGKYINAKAQFSTKPSKTELIVISYAHSLAVRELLDVHYNMNVNVT